MSFHDWLYSVYPENAVINGRFGALHIGVALLCAALCVAIALMGNRSRRTRYGIVLALALGIALFEVTRRVINLSRGWAGFWDLVYILIPRPWCAISCWMTMTAVFTRKRVLCNFCAMNGLLCALVFFAYPSVGFNHRVILFENLYSIATHSLLLITSVSLMTLGFTDFRLESGEIAVTGALLAGVYGYASAEILLKIEKDPLYFMPGNEVQAFLGVEYGPFLVIYAVFLTVFFSSFFLVQKALDTKQRKPKLASL